MRILAVDDDEGFVFGLRGLLRRDGCEVTGARSGREAMELSVSSVWDAVLLDLGLPDMAGLDVLRELAEIRGHPPVIVLSGRDEARTAAEALRLGAMTYLTKPAPREDLLRAIAEVRERRSLQERLSGARREAGTPAAGALGNSPAWHAAMDDLCAAAAAPRTPVLVTGESGTGKELAATQIHAWSARAHRPLVSLNAACFQSSLLESELFGHEAGAFTGAAGARRGVFELASGGTLFLDEIGELPIELQPKLLRVLEGHPFRRVGGERLITADVRVVSATNRRLPELVAAGRFRLDLYHRLRVVEVTLPPLRERGADRDLLAVHFVSNMAAELGKPDIEIAPETLRAIRAYGWPGNVRELRNALERAIVLCKSSRLTPGDLPPEVRGPSTPAAAEATPRRPRASRELEHVVKEHVLQVYGETGENLAQAARALGIGRATLRRKLRDYGLTSADPARRPPA
jgi:two-component system, NtrC family, response regulator AtoC